MEYRSLYDYYWFGTCVRYLQDCKTGNLVKGSRLIESNLKDFFTYLDTLGMEVTRRVAEDILGGLREELNKYEENQGITDEHALRLVNGMSTVRVTLDAEIKGIGAYSPTPKQIDLDKLIDNIPGLFMPGVFVTLPAIARYDFQEAGKCIAFERPTAAAFHIVRATEDVLRHYYRQMVRRNRIGSQNWGPIVQDLRRRTRTKKHDVLNNHLDNIRDSFRNPTQHPEARYDIHEVQDLWSVCVDVVNRMIRTLKSEDRL